MQVAGTKQLEGLSAGPASRRDGLGAAQLFARALHASMHRAPLLSRHSVRSLQHRQASVLALLSTPARPPPRFMRSMAADLMVTKVANGSTDAATLSATQQAATADAGAATDAATPLRDGSNGASTASDEFSPGAQQNTSAMAAKDAVYDGAACWPEVAGHSWPATHRKGALKRRISAADDPQSGLDVRRLVPLSCMMSQLRVVR